MRQAVLYSADFMLNFGKLLIKDVPAARMADQPGGVVNHPLWIAGHLANTADSVVGLFGEQRRFDEAWQNKFKPGSKPVADASQYPDMDTLLSSLEERHKLLKQVYLNADDAMLSRELADERRRQRFQTNGKFLVFVLTAHPALHWGQLSAWRRAAGLPSVL